VNPDTNGCCFMEEMTTVYFWLWTYVPSNATNQERHQIYIVRELWWSPHYQFLLSSAKLSSNILRLDWMLSAHTSRSAMHIHSRIFPCITHSFAHSLKHTSTHAHMHPCLHTYVHTPMHIHTYLRTYIRTYRNTYVHT